MPDKDNLIESNPAATHGAAGTTPPGPGSPRVVVFNISHPLSLISSQTSTYSSQIRRVRPDRLSPGQVRQTLTIPVIFGHGSMGTLLVVLVMLNRLTDDWQGQVHLPQGRLEVFEGGQVAGRAALNSTQSPVDFGINHQGKALQGVSPPPLEAARDDAPEVDQARRAGHASSRRSDSGQRCYATWSGPIREGGGRSSRPFRGDPAEFFRFSRGS